MQSKFIIAHRGAPRQARENTLEAFEIAINCGADAIELDVRKTKDNVLVCFHNATISRRLIRKLNVTDLNALAERLGFTVPTLKEALKLISGKVRVYIEIKEKDCGEQVAQIALGILSPKDFAIISFHHEPLQIIRRFYPNVLVGMHLGMRYRTLSQIAVLLRQKKILNFIDFFLPHVWLWTSKFGNIIPKKFPFVIWTVDRPSIIKKALADDRVVGIITNFPDRALSLRNKIYAK